MRVFLVFLCALFLCACAPVEQPNIDPRRARINNSLPVIVESMNHRISGHLLEVEVVLQSDSQYFRDTIAYKIDWLDKDGFVLPSSRQNAYKSFLIEPRRQFVIKEIATDNRAVDFVIYIENLNQRSTR